MYYSKIKIEKTELKSQKEKKTAGAEDVYISTQNFMR